MFHRKKSVFRYILVLISMFGATLTNANEEYELVSIIRLIATPDNYHGKKVYVIGWAQIEHENFSVCLSKDSLTTKNCLWINIEDNINSGFGKLSANEKLELLYSINNKKVVIKGEFDANDTGHLGGWSGGIKNVYKIKGLSKSHNQ